MKIQLQNVFNYAIIFGWLSFPNPLISEYAYTRKIILYILHLQIVTTK